MNARQQQALLATAKNQPRYSSAQMEALTRNAPTPEDILENDEYRAELIEELEYTMKEKGIAVPKVAFEDAAAEVLPAARPAMGTLADLNVDGPDLDAELAAMEQQLANKRAEVEAAAAAAPAEAPEQPEMSREEMIRAQIMELLASTPGAPTAAQIEGLKRKYGQNGVHVTALGEGDVYLYTYLRRSQWKKIQELVSKAAQAQVGGDPNDMLKEKVIQYCVIWPKEVSTVEFLYSARAGVMDTLYNMIMLQSYFLEPAQALQLTVTL
jgi:hypothetical protein